MNKIVEPSPTIEPNVSAQPRSETSNTSNRSRGEGLFATPSSQNSLFGRDSRVVSASSILNETNRAAMRRGKKPMPRLHIGSNARNTDEERSDHEILPEDSVSQRQSSPFESDTKWSYRVDGWSEPERNTRRPLPSVALRTSQEIQARVHEYHRELRRRYVLQMLRDCDLEQYSFTLIAPQEIVIDQEAEVVYNIARPELTQRLYPISEREIQKLRATYPEPFTSNDPSPYRRPSDARPPTSNNNGGSGGEQPGGDGPSDHEGDGSHASRPIEDNHRDRQPNRRDGPDGSHPPGGPPDGPPDGNGPPSNSGEPDHEPLGSDVESERGDTGDQRKGVRYTSVDPETMTRNKWDYDPTPLSQEEMLKAAFSVFEKLIVKQLYCEPAMNNSSVQKTLLQSLPKPGDYRGEDDLTVFDA